MKVRILPPMSPELACPRCLSSELHRSGTHHIGHMVLDQIGIGRFRCLACRERFVWFPESWSVSGRLYALMGLVFGRTLRPAPAPAEGSVRRARVQVHPTPTRWARR